jgi:hypothetical protein
MKTKIIFRNDDQQYSEWKKGDEGFIEGFIYTNRPYMVIVNLRTKQPVLVSFGGTVDVVV